MIFVILAVLFTSVRVGLIALIPNAIPVLLYFGLMGWFGVRLNVITGLVACIVLGIAVDDTIHYLSRFAACARQHADERLGTVAALRSVGPPITATTVALCLGFLTLTQTNLRTQVHFGALGAATIAIAWLIDVTLTPALSSRLRIINLWDVLTLDLGPEPHRTIPIFRGLRRAQARLVALMMTLRSLPKGERLFRAGAAGDDLYVVIDGELSVRLATPEGGEELGRLDPLALHQHPVGAVEVADEAPGALHLEHAVAPAHPPGRQVDGVVRLAAGMVLALAQGEDGAEGGALDHAQLHGVSGEGCRSSRSPGTVPVAARTPSGSSTTRRAPRTGGVMRQGRRPAQVRRTTSWASRNATSIG